MWLSLSKIRFFRDSNPESESKQRFESEPESESQLEGHKSTRNQSTYFNLEFSNWLQEKSNHILMLFFVICCYNLQNFNFSIKNQGKMFIFQTFLGEFWDLQIHSCGFESQIHESTCQRFESHESNGKLTPNAHDYGLFFIIFFCRLQRKVIGNYDDAEPSLT